MADLTADQIRQAMDQMKAHYDTELRQAIASIQKLEARLADVEAERDRLIAEHDHDMRGAVRNLLFIEVAELKAKLAAVEALCDEASVLEIDFGLRDRILAAARGESDRG